VGVVVIRQYELVERVKAYEPGFDEKLLNRAYVFSMKAHGAQKRASGDPFFSHPLEVAGILTGLKLDSASIVTGLLHDTVEDTLATLDEIEDRFGSEVATLVDGVTKLSRIELQSDQARQAENFRKFLIAMSEDIRVLLVKLADRLHNMRTLQYISKEVTRRRIAMETMDIYAPLAGRIGLHGIKDELEDLAFSELNPSARASVLKRLNFLREEGGGQVPKVLEGLRGTLKDAGLSCEITGREKRPYSIWLKMQRKNIAFEQISDIVAFRVVLKDTNECYQALGTVHGAYPMVPGRFKDYVSTPKPNGYRSLHTAVIGPERQRIEIQIRTQEMHAEAEYGVAAHWAFKDVKDTSDATKKYRWIRELLDILDKAAGPEEFLENTKLEMFQDQVFCFSPKGDLVDLPGGATPVDFAYAVHSEVGDSCVGAKINGQMVPLRTQLQNGDQVEIIRSRVPAPSPTWEGFVVTGKARASIRRFVRFKEREEFISLGRAIAEKTFRENSINFDVERIEVILPLLQLSSVEDFYAKLGSGELTGRKLNDILFPSRGLESITTRALSFVRKRSGDVKAGDQGIPIRGLTPGMAVHIADCCSPLPGDRIVGIVTTGRGVMVHTIDCGTLADFGDTPERWLDLSWDQDGTVGEAYVGRIDMVVVNETGSLSEVTAAIARSKGNISNLKITSRKQDFFELQVDVEVADLHHLSEIIANLRAVPCVSRVKRGRN
tara:strand:- start:48680 stop:50842 length:2163 start_codon:yes stop_codon:yes gene_type:complete